MLPDTPKTTRFPVSFVSCVAIAIFPGSSIVQSPKSKVAGRASLRCSRLTAGEDVGFWTLDIGRCGGLRVQRAVAVVRPQHPLDVGARLVEWDLLGEFLRT